MESKIKKKKKEEEKLVEKEKKNSRSVYVPKFGSYFAFFILNMVIVIKIEKKTTKKQKQW